MYHTISEAAHLLGVHPTTIRRWHKANKIRCHRTLGNHRRIHRNEIKRILDGKKRKYKQKKRGTAIYARVSSHDQKKKGDLARQQDLLKNTCKELGLNVDHELTDVGSGLNAKRRGLLKLFKLVTKGKISTVVISYRDRITRFGFGYISEFFSSYGVEIHIVNGKEDKSMHDELVEDMLAIMSSFSGRIHGMRSRKNYQKISE